MKRAVLRCAIVMAALAPRGPAWAAPLDAHRFVAEIESHLNQDVTLAGRFASQVGDRLKLVGVDLEIRLDELAGRLKPGTQNVEVTGRAIRDGDRIVFRADSVLAVPGDVELFRGRRARLRDDDYAGLYELSRWARSQANRYDDGELRQLAAGAYREAFAWEETALTARHDGDGLLALAERGRSLGLERDQVTRLRHKALWIVRRGLGPRDLDGLHALGERIARLLPFAGADPLPLADDVRAAYLADPLAVFEHTKPEGRVDLFRAFWADVTQARLRLAAALGQAPLPLAEEAARVVPEFPELAREFRLAHLEQQARIPVRLARGKMLSLRRDFTELGLPERGDEILRTWLAGQRETLPPGDARARQALAEDFLDLIGDAETAAVLLREAWSIAPGAADVERELHALGYELVSGRWQRTDELRASSIEADRRRRVGGIAVGDDERAVVARLRAPDRVARTVSVTGVFEQWIYDGPPTTYIYLRRTTAGGLATVVAIEGPAAGAERPE